MRELEPESISAAASPVPERSTCFQLTPIAVGTSLVEGLSRYLNRLATEHSVSVSDFIELDVFPLPSSAAEDRRRRRRLFHASCYLMDGSESHTEPWIHALESATMQSGLRALTLLPYSRICEGSWLRRKRAWCPHCLEVWRRPHSTPYEPLVWSIKVTYRCVFHQVPLETNCQFCGRSAAPLAGMSQPGYCAWCLSWLGRPTAVCEQTPDPFELWCSDQVTALIAAMGKLPSLLADDAISQAMKSLLGSWTDVNRSSIAEYAGCTRRSISTWMEGTTRPRAESFFRLCYALNITPLSFLGYGGASLPSKLGTEDATNLVKNVLTPSISKRKRSGSPKDGRPAAVIARRASDGASLDQLRHALELAVQAEKYVSPRKIAKQLGYSSPDRVLQKFSNLCSILNARRVSEANRRLDRIRDRLRRALLEWPPPTLKSIAQELGMSNSTALRSIDPVLCQQILDHGEERKDQELNNIRALFERELVAKEFVSLKQFCRRHGLSLPLIVSKLPDLKKRYEVQYGYFMEGQRSQRERDFYRQVSTAVRSLQASGEYPSTGNVTQLSPKLRRVGWDKIQRAIEDARNSKNSFNG
jgi:transcriptional regulator with XRE-family HTH domain/AraC-like DNA-binding protein